MKLRTLFSLSVLIVFLSSPLFVCAAFADKHEHDEITNAIRQKQSRWTVKDTSVSKLAPEERKKRLGSQIPLRSFTEKKLAVPSVSLPVRLDWRDYSGGNYVTPVKEQGACGACWAFATTAALESKALISQNSPGMPIDLSEQILTSCSGAGTCSAGAINAAADFISNSGLPLESCYPYAAADGACASICPNWQDTAYKISGWSMVDPTVGAIKYTLYNYGPLVILMQAHTDFFYYSSGIYAHSWGDFEGYHAALLIGYDDVEQYFIVKSSWGADWGEAGYFRIAYSEMNSETLFGFWTIAYLNGIASSFPTVDGISRDASIANAKDQSKDESGNAGNGINTGAGEKSADPHDGVTGNADQSDGTNQDKNKNRSGEAPVLAGTVRDETGHVISGAEVKAGKYTVTTDSKGQYQFLSIPPGDYVVTVSKKDYVSTSANISIPTDKTVTKDFVISLSSSSQTNNGTPASNQSGIAGPGWFDGKGEMISPAAAEAYYAAKRKEYALAKPGTLPMAALAADINSEIQELAHALRHDPKLIYDYVHNNIDYVPYYGSLKGAMLTYLDGSGNDFDQASLMIALLRASGYTAQYQYGTMTIPGNQLANWLDVDQTSATIGTVIPSGGIPITNLQYNGTATINRVWVKATIGGQDYVFDPAFKTYSYMNKIDMVQALGYNQSDLMNSATSGATVTSDYVQNLNETNLRNKLATYASNLVGAIRSGFPDNNPNKDVNQVISGRNIIQTNLTTYQTTLPFVNPGTASWDDMPAEYTTTLRIQHVGIDFTISTHDLSGKRLTVTYNTGANNRPELLQDGNTPIGSGTYIGNGTTIGAKNDLIITIDHPYANNGPDGPHTYQDVTPQHPVVYSLTSGSTYAIVYNFGGISDTLLQKRQQQLEIYRAQAVPDAAEAVRGETLNIMGQTWLKEVAMSQRLLSALAETIVITHHNIGLMAQEGGYYIDVKAGNYTRLSKHNIVTDRHAHIKIGGLIGSAFEHGILGQLMGSSGASTISLLQIANSTGIKVFYVNGSNFASIWQQNNLSQKGYSSTGTNNDYSNFLTAVNNGHTLILPENGQLTSSGWQWTGKGYIDKFISADGNSLSIGMIIGGGYNGGYNAYYGDVSPTTISQTTTANITATYTPATITQVVSPIPPSTSRDPVDMAGGAFLHDRTDLALGGGAPLGLAFARSYNSNQNLSKRTLGSGWTHNYDIHLSPTSHGEPVLGNRQPVDAASFIAALYVCLDLLKTQDTIQAWMVASLASKWAIDQVIDNAVTVHLGSKVMEFVKLPDGTFSTPPGITSTLVKTGSDTYTLQERFGTNISFSKVNNNEIKIQSLTDVDGNAMTFTYSGDHLSTVQDAFGRTLTLAYSGDKIITVSDSAGRSVSYGYDGDNLTGYTDPESKVWGYGYSDPNHPHRMTSLTNPLNIITAANAYDSLGRVMTQTVPRQSGTNATYNFYFSGYRNQEVDPDGNAITYYYDAKGREYAVENPLGHKSVKVFDGQDHTVGITDPRLYSTTYLYDGNHNLTRVTNALNYFVTNVYDAQYRLTDTTDPLSHNTHFTYDSEHHLTATQDAIGNIIGTTYYGNGFKNTATDARGTTTTLTYDAYGSPLTTQTAGHPAVTYAYDAIGRMTGLTDQVSNATWFDYDKRNLLLHKILSPFGASTYAYDDAGRLTSKTDRNNNTISYTYTSTDKPAGVVYPGNAMVTFTYNQLDNLTSMQDSLGATGFAYDAAGRLTSTTDPRNFAVSYQYDAAGNVTRITYPGNKAVTYSYDELNRLKTVTNWLNQTATYTYDNAGRLTNFTNFNGTVTTYGYDNANRPTSLENKTSGGSVFAGYSFTLDGNGNRTGIVQNEPLVSALSTGDTSYTYNNKKNRLLSTTNGDSFGYTNEGELSSGYGTSYTFDYEHRLTNIGSSYQFVYDGRGNRLQATRNGQTTRYIYDAAGNLIAEADSNNIITRYYIYGQGLLALVTPADQTYCYHFNATGSTIAVTDASQAMVNKYAYDPFGNIAGQVEVIPQPFKYVGQFGVMAEQNGFYYMRARYYDPQVGRFISEDPIGFDGGDVNLYAYVQNNPVNAIDPGGKLAFLWHGGITLVAALNSGRGLGSSLSLAWDATTRDSKLFNPGTQGQTPEAVVQHAMAMPGQSRSSAITAAVNYINSSTTTVASSLHAAQDLATPAHAGQPWNTFGFNMETVNHLAGDLFPSISTIRNAYNNSMSVLNGSFGSGGK